MAVAVGRTSVSDRTKTLKVGDRAPDFELPGHRGGEKFSLSGMRGKKKVRAALEMFTHDTTPGKVVNKQVVGGG
jgi:hypothetical protein